MQHAPQVELRRGPALFAAPLPVEQHPYDILDMNVAQHMIARAFKDRQSRPLRGDEHAHDVVERSVGSDRMHVGPWHHQLTGLHAIELNRAKNELLFFWTEQPAFARLLDLNLQLLGRVHLRVAPASPKSQTGQYPPADFVEQ